MPVDTTQILDAATKLGQLAATHPAVGRYRDAQRAMTDDPDASRMMGEFNRHLETLARQEASGMPITDAQRSSIESLQTQLASHLKVKALQMAQVEFVDLLRKINQTVQAQITGTETPAAAGRPATSRLVV